MKRIVLTILTTFLILTLFIPAKAAETTKFSNLVLYVSFSDTETDYWDGTGQSMDLIYNTTARYNALSVKDYFPIVSCGKMELVNVMPQMMTDADNNITIVPITLDNNTDYYSNADSDYNLIQDTLDKLNADTELTAIITEELDCDEDGYIDNVTFLVACSETERDSKLYPHKSNAASYDLQINGITLNSYNVINYGRLSSAAGGAGVVAHELLHVLGPLDTYKVCSEGEGTCGEGPVGCWDIMAQNCAFLQYPLAYTRQELGWITIQEQSASGTYTLKSPQSDSDQYAMILKTDYSDSEFFVIEYRKQGSFYNEKPIDKIDDKIGGSGIIIYRVNTAASPKTNLTQDYIYVFRNGESEKTASIAGAQKAYLSVESGRTSYGSSNPVATTLDGAITYTDGTNSGIVISNVGSAGDDSITFNVEYSIDMTDACWEKQTYQSAMTSYESGIGFDLAMLNDTLYGGNVVMEVYNNKLYGLYTNKSGKAELLCYEGDAWTSVQVVSKNDSYGVDMTVGKDGLLYIVCEENYSTIRLLSMDKEEKITDVTDNFAGSGNSCANPQIATSRKGVVISYRDYMNGDRVHTFIKNEDGWDELGINIEMKSNVFRLSEYDDNVYLAIANDNSNYVYQCDLAQNDSFDMLTDTYTDGTVTCVELFFDEGGVPYVAYYDAAKSVVIVKGYQNNSWNSVGMNVYNQMVSSLNGIVMDGQIYVAYQGSDVCAIKRHASLSGKVDIGDSSTEEKTEDSSDSNDKEENDLGDFSESEASKDSTIKQGDLVVDQDNKATYKVSGSNTVQYVAPKDKTKTTVVIPSTITVNNKVYKVTSVAAKAFYGNKKIKRITIGKNVTAIGDKAFYKCVGLKQITIPSKVKRIGKQAFYGCKRLKTIRIKTTKLTKKNVGSKAFKGIHKKATIKVPKKKLKSYKSILKKKGIGKGVKIKKL